jgi:acyl carrier protein
MSEDTGLTDEAAIGGSAVTGGSAMTGGSAVTGGSALTQASLAQHGIWVTASTAATSGGGSAAYHMPVVIHFGSSLDVGALTKACAALADRHPLLAAAVEYRDGVAHLVAGTAPLLRLADNGESVADEIARSFDLAAGPLARFVLFADVSGSTGSAGSIDSKGSTDASDSTGSTDPIGFAGPTLVITVHHLAFDGHSKDVLVRDLATFYNGEIPPPPPAPFATWAAAERERVDAATPAATAFWRHRWSEPPPLTVADQVLTSRQAGPGEVIEFPLAAPAVDDVTRFEAVLAAVHALLHQYGNPAVTTAVDLSTRTPDAADLVGPMVNELPVTSEPTDGTPFDDYARLLRATLRAVYPHREVPLARAVDRIRPHAALTPISVSYRRRRPEPRFSGVDSAVEWTAFNGAVRGDLQLQIVDSGTDLRASLRYSPAAAPVAATFAQHLQTVTERLSADPTLPVGDLLAQEAGPALTAAEPATASPAGARPAGVQPVGAQPLGPQPAGVQLVSAQPVGPQPARAQPGWAPPAQAGPEAAAQGADLSAAELADRIRAIWEEVLAISPIGDDDDLFDLGGHSLTMTQIIARVRKSLRIDVSLDAFFDDPTVSGVVRAVLSHQ